MKRAASTARTWLLVAWLGLGLAAPAAAERHALLVGVTEYQHLPPALQLKAPANDVRLMRQVLLQRGLDASRIEMLADGVEGAALPTRDAIVSALQRLAGRARSGDTVLLYFSGHGSLQPAATAPGEPVRWQPVFLPRDVRQWEEGREGRSAAQIPGALTDATLRALIDRINDSGAFVWAVFEACHSAKLVRGALPGTDAQQLRVHQVPPSALGVPGLAPPDVQPVWADRSQPPPQAGRGLAAYFYAAQSVEQAPSAPLQGGDAAAWHGLFTYAIAQALALGQPMSYRQLSQHVLASHDRLPMTTATPLASGNGLDQPVLGQEAPALRQWPLQAGRDGLALAAGALSGLAEGALLAVLADPLAPAARGAAQPPSGTLGFVRVTAVDANRAQLQPVAWQGWAALTAQAVPRGSWARLLAAPPAYTLRVALDRGGCGGDCLAGRAVAQLQRNGVPGVEVRWAASGADAAADLRLRADDAGVRLLLAGEADGAGAGWGVAVPVASTAGGSPAGDVDQAAQVDALAQATAAALHRIARQRNLLRLAAQRALAAPAGLFMPTVKLRRGSSGPDTAVAAERMATLHVDDWVIAEGRNSSGDAVDVSLFWLGADQSIRRVFPSFVGESARLAAGERLPPLGVHILAGTSGIERLLVLSVPMQHQQEVADFAFLTQPPVGRLRSASDPTLQASLQALWDACCAGHTTRGAALPALPPERLGMQVFTFDVRP